MSDKNTKKTKIDLPLLFANTFDAKQGKRAFASVVKFDAKNELPEAIDLNNDLKDRQYIRLVTACNFSELFPYVSAASVFNDYTLVDGGYFDNFGLTTTLDLAKQLRAVLAKKPYGKNIKIKVIGIWNDYSEEKGKIEDVSKRKVEKTNISQAIVPVQGMYNSVFEGLSHKQLVELRENAQSKGIDDFKCIILSDSTTVIVPLTRILTKDAINYMKEESKKEIHRF